MEIVDINFNFEQFEEIVKGHQRKCEKARDAVNEYFEVYREAQRNSWIANCSQAHAEEYDIAVGLIKWDIEKSLNELEEQTKQLAKAIDFYVAFMQARIEYICENNTTDQLYANYKLRSEYNTLRRRVSDYIGLRVSYSKLPHQKRAAIFGETSQDEPENN